MSISQATIPEIPDQTLYSANLTVILLYFDHNKLGTYNSLTYSKLFLELKQSIKQTEKLKPCNSGLKSVVVNFLKQEALLIPKIHTEGQNNTLQGCKNMDRETLNGENISNYSCSVTYIRKRSWAGDCSDPRMAHGSVDLASGFALRTVPREWE